MQLHVEDIQDQGLVLEFCEEPGTFPALVDLQQSGECLFGEPIRVRARVRRIDALIEVEGSVRTTVGLPCSRCLAPFELKLDIDFAVTYAEELPVVTGEEEGQEIELQPEDLGLIAYSGEEIDLREAIQEQLIMGLPLRPLCSADCLGLCPYCGVDRNETRCDCEPPVFNARFGALKNLKIEKDGK